MKEACALAVPVAIIVSQVVAVVVWLAATLGLAVFLLFCLGRFRYVPFDRV